MGRNNLLQNLIATFVFSQAISSAISAAARTFEVFHLVIHQLPVEVDPGPSVCDTDGGETQVSGPC